MDYSPPGSSIYGILQTRILEWVVIPFSRVLSSEKAQALVRVREKGSMVLGPG